MSALAAPHQYLSRPRRTIEHSTNAIRRSLTELTSYRILMHVIDRESDSLWTEQIPVVTGTFLPIAKRLNSGTLADRQSFQQRTPLSGEDLFNSV